MEAWKCVDNLLHELKTQDFKQVLAEKAVELDLFLDGFLVAILEGDGEWYKLGNNPKGRLINALHRVAETGSLLA